MIKPGPNRHLIWVEFSHSAGTSNPYPHDHRLSSSDPIVKGTGFSSFPSRHAYSPSRKHAKTLANVFMSVSTKFVVLQSLLNHNFLVFFFYSHVRATLRSSYYPSQHKTSIGVSKSPSPNRHCNVTYAS